jgi:hypothetical protein
MDQHGRTRGVGEDAWVLPYGEDAWVLPYVLPWAGGRMGPPLRPAMGGRTHGSSPTYILTTTALPFLNCTSCALSLPRQATFTV